MSSAWKIVALCALVPAMAAAPPRAMFGVVTDRQALVPGGVLVQAVRPESPAQRIGLQVGDVLLSLHGVEVRNREVLKNVLNSLAPGDEVAVEWLKHGEKQQAKVKLDARKGLRGMAHRSPDAAVGGDRMLRPLVVDPAIREAMRGHRRAVVTQLAALPDGLVPAEVTDRLQAIRHLARDANARGRGWMLGEAGEVTLQFRDAAGILVLHGANQLLTLSVYNQAGALTHTLPLNTPEERLAVPVEIIARLKALR